MGFILRSHPLQAISQLCVIYTQVSFELYTEGVCSPFPAYGIEQIEKQLGLASKEYVTCQFSSTVFRC
jgi:hypothetical protein